jgi:AcrR family transcriptional regulator
MAMTSPADRPPSPAGRAGATGRGRPVRRTQQERIEETRRALLQAGRDLLLEVGYARLSVAQITRRAGRAHGTFYLHFENRRELVAVLLDELAERARAGAPEIWRTSSDVEAIWRGLRGFFRQVTPGRTAWMLVEEVTAVEGDDGSLRDKLREIYVEPVLRGLRERPADLPLTDVDLELLAQILAATGLHFARTGRLPASPEVTALHLTVVWCRAIGRAVDEGQLAALRALFPAERAAAGTAGP